MSLLGVGLLSVPLFDIWDDATNLGWQVTTTFAENLLFLVLTGVLIGGGIWLVRTNWETDQVMMIAWRTVGATGVITLLIGWAVLTQSLAMQGLKPYVLAFDGVLVGAVTAFGLSVSTVRANILEAEARRERSMNERLELLYRSASELETATTHAEAYDVVETAIADVLTEPEFHVVVDNEVVVDHGRPGAIAPDSRTVVEIGGRGQIELRNEHLESHEETTVKLFASFLDETIRRIEREERLRDERDILEFINRTLRHDIKGDLALVEARLEMLDRNDAVPDDRNEDHLQVALDRAEEMDEFVQTMRTYMQSVLSDDHALEAVALGPVVDEHVASVRDSHPGAEIVIEAVPDAAVTADDLLDRVIANLLRNAIEHNEASTPRVVIDGERRDGIVQLRVADNGPGIPESRRTSIFEQGKRGIESGGTGFGLYLVKDVVESYGGAVRVRDNDPRGTVFELDLPVASATC